MSRMSLLTELQNNSAPRAINISLLTEPQSGLWESQILRLYHTTEFPNTL